MHCVGHLCPEAVGVESSGGHETAQGIIRVLAQGLLGTVAIPVPCPDQAVGIVIFIRVFLIVGLAADLCRGFRCQHLAVECVGVVRDALAAQMVRGACPHRLLLPVVIDDRVVVAEDARGVEVRLDAARLEAPAVLRVRALLHRRRESRGHPVPADEIVSVVIRHRIDGCLCQVYAGYAVALEGGAPVVFRKDAVPLQGFAIVGVCPLACPREARPAVPVGDREHPFPRLAEVAVLGEDEAARLVVYVVDWVASGQILVDAAVQAVIAVLVGIPVYLAVAGAGRAVEHVGGGCGRENEAEVPRPGVIDIVGLARCGLLHPHPAALVLVGSRRASVLVGDRLGVEQLVAHEAYRRGPLDEPKACDGGDRAADVAAVVAVVPRRARSGRAGG